MASKGPSVVGGLFEIGVGVPDLAAGIAFWRGLGYRPGASGELAAAEATRLYGVESSVQSVRLLHQNADHGLIRLMQWQHPTGSGLNMARLRTVGNRWGVHRTEDIMTLLNHAEVLEQQGGTINRLGPIINAHVSGFEGSPQKPFEEPLVCLRELQLMQPHYQLLVTKRYGIELPLYGKIAPSSLFRCTQVCHAGTVSHFDDLEVFSFYDQVLGLKRMSELKVDYEAGNIATIMFDLEPGDALTVIDFDDTRSRLPLDQQRSGRLRIFNITSQTAIEDRRADSRPGNLGYSLYTYRVNDVRTMYDKISSSAVQQVSEVVEDEFGQAAFSFVAPDGYFWTLIQANEAQLQ